MIILHFIRLVAAALFMAVMTTATSAQMSLGGSASYDGPIGSRLSLSGSCTSCDMSHRDMSRISLKGSDFSHSNFNRSILSGGNLNESNLTGAQFTRSFLVNAKGDGVNFRDATLSDATIRGAQLNRSDFSSARLQRADLSGGEFKGSDFSQTEFTNAEASRANFTDAIFSLAKLHHTNFNNAIFIAAQLQFTEFGTADVSNVDFTAANFSGADLRRVRGITQAQLDQGCGNSDTQLPSGMSIALCPEYLKIASLNNSDSSVIMRTDVTLDLAGKLAITKSGLAENIRTLDRAIAALPKSGSAAARAELKMSRAHLMQLYNDL